MSEKPILFSGPMVQAILDGRKTMTRRVLKPQPLWQKPVIKDGVWQRELSVNGTVFAPYKLHAAGDLLWVKERFSIKSWNEDGEFLFTYAVDGAFSGYRYADSDDYLERLCNRLDAAGVRIEGENYVDIPKALLSRPSLFMPRWASRITLRLTAVKVERLQDISEEDAKAEGAIPTEMGTIRNAIRSTYKSAFQDIWQSINGPGSWDANPWVAAYSFERVTP